VGSFVTNLTALSIALFDGVYHAVVTSVLEQRIPGMTAQRVGGVFGEVFEEYVLDILAAAFGDQLIHVPPDGQARRSDALIVYTDRIAVIEIKGGHYRGIEHRGRLSLEDREEELRALGIEDAAEQIAQTVADLRNGFSLDGLPRYDWTATQIVPVIITLERLPLLPSLWRMFERLSDPLRRLPLQDQLVRVRFLGVDDVERLPDLCKSTNTDLGLLFAMWARDPRYFDRPLAHYLDAQGIRVAESFMRSRAGSIRRCFSERYGLELAFPAAGAEDQ
jgi:hypothetical protein